MPEHSIASPLSVDELLLFTAELSIYEIRGGFTESNRKVKPSEKLPGNDVYQPSETKLAQVEMVFSISE